MATADSVFSINNGKRKAIDATDNDEIAKRIKVERSIKAAHYKKSSAAEKQRLAVEFPHFVEEVVDKYYDPIKFNSSEIREILELKYNTKFHVVAGKHLDYSVYSTPLKHAFLHKKTDFVFFVGELAQ
jgi:hypothetical protein